MSGSSVVGSTWASSDLQSAAPQLQPDLCAGDERISFVPADPSAGQAILVTVSSASSHRGAFLIGSAPADPKPTFQGQLGVTWPFIVVPKNGGLHVFRFYVDGLLLCAEASVMVQPNSAANAVAPTPTPNSKSDHDNGNSSNGNGNSNGNGDNGNDNDDPQPVLQAIQPANVCIDQRATLTGRGFGSSRSSAHGQVTISGSSASKVLEWGSRKIVVLVPRSAKTGSDREIFVATDGGFSTVKATVFDNC
jgi:hypothetical protein